MTERQIKSVRLKIEKIKKALAADKRKHGGFYDDSRGIRYLPPELYIKLEDYSGALKYFNWFDRNFPDDLGYPDFLFEWTITLFYCKKLIEAERKAYKTYFSNSYYFDKYFNKPLNNHFRVYTSNWEYKDMIDTFIYSSVQKELIDFTNWLYELVNSEKFVQIIKNYNELNKLLEKEPVGRKRTEILKRMRIISNSM